MITNIEVFDGFGVEIIKQLAQFDFEKYVIIDEVGFAELDARSYRNQLLKLLNQRKNIVAVLRDEANELIEQIKTIKGAQFVRLENAFLTRKHC